MPAAQRRRKPAPSEAGRRPRSRPWEKKRVGAGWHQPFFAPKAGRRLAVPTRLTWCTRGRTRPCVNDHIRNRGPDSTLRAAALRVLPRPPALRVPGLSRNEQPYGLQFLPRPTKQKKKRGEKMPRFFFCSEGRTRTGDPLITRDPIVSNRRGLSLHHIL